MNKTHSFRPGGANDFEAIAKLHALSWQTHYRGICPDHYLDHLIHDERKKVWHDRFAQPNPDQLVILVEDVTSGLSGFSCTYTQHHEKYGAYLDNLHVHPNCQGLGLGRELMKASARLVSERSKDASIYLHVLKENHGAIGFYEKIGGRRIAEYEEQLPWGGSGVVIDYLWELDQLI